MFRFTIRELLLLTLVIGLGLGWAIRERAWIDKHSATTFDAQKWQARAEVLAEAWEAEGHGVHWTDSTINILFSRGDASRATTTAIP